MCVWVYILVHRYTCAVRGSQQVSSSVAFQFAFWDSVSLNLDLLFWLAWLAIELMGSCRCSTSAEVIEVCCHTCIWCECWGSKVMASGSCSGPLLTELSSLLCVGICYCHRWEAFNWTLDGRAPFLSYTFTLLVLLSFLTMNLCESPPETCYWHLQNFESNLFKPFIKLICFMYFTIVMKMD